MDIEIEGATAVSALPTKGLAVTAEHKVEWVRRFHESGLSAEKFTHLHGIRRATFRQWVKREQHEEQPRRESSVASFIELQMPVSPLPQPSWSAELTFANGNRLRVSGEIPAAVLEQLLRVC